MSNLKFKRFEGEVHPAQDGQGFVVTVHGIGLPDNKVALAQVVSHRLALELTAALTDELVQDAIKSLTYPAIKQAANANKLRNVFGVPEEFVEPINLDKVVVEPAKG